LDVGPSWTAGNCGNTERIDNEFDFLKTADPVLKAQRSLRISATRPLGGGRYFVL
jgi:hypothetical protein